MFVGLLLPQNVELLHHRFGNGILHEKAYQLYPARRQRMILCHRINAGFYFCPVCRSYLPHDIRQITTGCRSHQSVLLGRKPCYQAVDPVVRRDVFGQIIFIEHHQQRLAGRIIFYLPPMCRQPMQSRLVGHKYPIASAIGIGQYARRHKRKLHPEQGICHIHPDHRIALSAKSDGKTLRPEQSPVVGIVLANFQFLPVCPES